MKQSEVKLNVEYVDSKGTSLKPVKWERLAQKWVPDASATKKLVCEDGTICTPRKLFGTPEEYEQKILEDAKAAMMREQEHREFLRRIEDFGVVGDRIQNKMRLVAAFAIYLDKCEDFDLGEHGWLRGMV